MSFHPDEQPAGETREDQRLAGLEERLLHPIVTRDLGGPLVGLLDGPRRRLPVD
jgi:hypothetical protein